MLDYLRARHAVSDMGSGTPDLRFHAHGGTRDINNLSSGCRQQLGIHNLICSVIVTLAPSDGTASSTRLSQSLLSGRHGIAW